MSMNMEARLVEYPVGTVLERVCVGCGTAYVWVSEPGRQRATIYCSKRCRHRGTAERRVKRVQLTEDRPEVAEGLALLICARCWVPFGWAPHAESSDDSPPLYHSLSCKYRAKRDRKKRRDEDTRPTRQEQHPVNEDAERLAAVSAAARELLLPATHCASCGKVASPTEEAAKFAKRAIEQRAGRTNEVRYYRCQEGWWHWTRVDASLDGWRRRQVEQLMTESPASAEHRGTESFRVVPR